MLQRTALQKVPKTLHTGEIRTRDLLIRWRSRVARWFVFKPKIPIWVNFVGPWNVKCGYIL
jgi:hypothetical protein